MNRESSTKPCQTECVHPWSADLGSLPTEKIVERFFRASEPICTILRGTHDTMAEIADLFAKTLRTGHRVFYLGAGTSGRLGILDAAELPDTFGIAPDRVVAILAGGSEALTQDVPGAEDDANAGAADIARRGVGAGDLVIGISASGCTAYVRGGMQAAASMGAATASITNNTDTPIESLADLALVLPTGPELICGSTRLMAGTVQKIILSALSTIAMIRLGRVFRGHMVGVVITNENRRQRAENMLCDLVAAPSDAVRAALAAAQDDVRVALLMLEADVDASTARKTLAQAKDSIESALARLSANKPSPKGKPVGPDNRCIRVHGGRVWCDGLFVPMDLIIESGRIVEMGSETAESPGQTLDASGCWVVPGFIDLHIHGGGGADFVDGTEAAVQAIADFQATHGTTRTLASLVPVEWDRLREAVHSLSKLSMPALLGIHLEGPFVSPRKPGALDVSRMRAPDEAAFRELVAGCHNAVRMVTFAPELPGSSALLTAIGEIGAVAAIGHSDASYAEVASAIASGAQHITHLFNAMREMHHREPGVVGAALGDSRVSLELIADGIHVHPSIIRFVIEDLVHRDQLDRLCLISDAIRASGRSDGTYMLGEIEMVVRNGMAQLKDGTLAGSMLTLDQALRNVIEYGGLSLAEAISLVSRNPARVLGEEDLGTLRPGAQADVVLLDEDLRVHTTIRAGEIVYEAGA